MLLLEQNDKISKITMSFFSPYQDNYFAFRIENENQNFKLFGESSRTDISISDIAQKDEMIKILV